MSNGNYDRFNHFIIYYRRLQNFDENDKEENTMMNMEDYKQVLVDPRTTHYSFTFRVNKINFYFENFFVWFLFR
jgi:hypothetical protein